MSGTHPSPSGDEKQSDAKSQRNANGEPQQSFFGIPDGAIGVLVSAAFAVLLNHISTSPVVLYFWAFGFTIWLFWKFRPREVFRRTLLCVLCGLIWIVTHIYVVRELKVLPAPPSPDTAVEIGMHILNVRGWPTMITNGFIKSPFSNGMAVELGSSGGFCGVPVAAGVTNVGIELVVVNSPKSDAERVTVKIELQKSVGNWILAPNWSESEIEDDPSIDCYMFEFPSIESGGLRSLPPIIFFRGSTNVAFKADPIGVLVSAKAMRSFLLNLNFAVLADCPLTPVPKPFVARAKRHIMSVVNGTTNWNNDLNLRFVGSVKDGVTNWVITDALGTSSASPMTLTIREQPQIHGTSQRLTVAVTSIVVSVLVISVVVYAIRS